VLDRNRLIIIIVGALLVLAMVVGVILWLTSGNQGPTSDPSQPREDPQEIETPTITFTEEQERTIRNVAAVSTRWDGAADPAQMEQRYVDSGMSQKLARSYEPVWAGYFGTNITAEIISTVTGTPTVLQYAPHEGDGTDGASPLAPNGQGKFLVSVEVTYEGTFRNDNGKPVLISPARAVWQYVLDERTGTVTDVEQPLLGDLALPDPEPEPTETP